MDPKNDKKQKKKAVEKKQSFLKKLICGGSQTTEARDGRHFEENARSKTQLKKKKPMGMTLGTEGPEEEQIGHSMTSYQLATNSNGRTSSLLRQSQQKESLLLANSEARGDIINFNSNGDTPNPPLDSTYQYDAQEEESYPRKSVQPKAGRKGD